MSNELEDIIKGKSKNQIAHLFVRAILYTGYVHPGALYWLTTNLSLIRFLDILEEEVAFKPTWIQKMPTYKSNPAIKKIVRMLYYEC